MSNVDALLDFDESPTSAPPAQNGTSKSVDPFDPFGPSPTEESGDVEFLVDFGTSSKDSSTEQPQPLNPLYDMMHTNNSHSEDLLVDFNQNGKQQDSQEFEFTIETSATDEQEEEGSDHYEEQEDERVEQDEREEEQSEEEEEEEEVEDDSREPEVSSGDEDSTEVVQTTRQEDGELVTETTTKTRHVNEDGGVVIKTETEVITTKTRTGDFMHDVVLDPQRLLARTHSESTLATYEGDNASMYLADFDDQGVDGGPDTANLDDFQGEDEDKDVKRREQRIKERMQLHALSESGSSEDEGEEERDHEINEVFQANRPEEIELPEPEKGKAPSSVSSTEEKENAADSRRPRSLSRSFEEYSDMYEEYKPPKKYVKPPVKEDKGPKTVIVGLHTFGASQVAVPKKADRTSLSSQPDDTPRELVRCECC
ncbi:histone-lysine N-methyltransferase SETD1B isoform X2 [Lingula anatina]|uniref:Histone-lysine N-methyltransferase SETD1B isoform X2 n=1 Tax=Lingula anatina TaxID=7574 RepID=A0A1S3ID17_LINAN|nr:histone-lysine N-methyltransferase SETD1B isoform X2 [Lingula anatina]|eukprot:XP_013396058.1 histone-lysine N-methyltransferase SETD1B isoform X2 [Lingula anatina]